MGYYPQVYKPGAPKTLGILSIIFGSIIALMSAVNLAAGEAFGLKMQHTEGQRADFEAFTQSIHGVTLLQGVVMLVMSVALIWIGIGQRKYMRWAQSATVKWALIGLGWLVVNAVLQFVVVMPAMDKFMESTMSHLPGGDAIGGAMNGAVKFGSLLGIAIYAAYPIILLVNFRKPQIVAVMDQPSMPTATVVQ